MSTWGNEIDTTLSVECAPMTTLAPPVKRIAYNPWAEPLYAQHGTTPYDYMLVDGGRGSSKTYEVSRSLIIKGHQQPLRIVVAREHLKSIDESAKPELEERIKELGLMADWGYRVTRSSIDHAIGTHIFFVGLSRLSEDDIKGLAMVDIAWLEEAQYISPASLDLLRPTIRKDDSQILATYNQTFRTDAISKFQVAMKGNPRVWHRHVTYTNNKFFTARNDRDRLDDMELNPDQYAHVWEGDFDDLSGDKRFLPYALIQMAVDAHEQGLAPIIPKGAHYQAGLDISDTGPDYNALVVRWGPTIVHASRWHNSDQGATVRKAHEVLLPYMPREGRLYYDSQGVGTGAKVYFNDVLVNRPYTVRPFKFGAVAGWQRREGGLAQHERGAVR